MKKIIINEKTTNTKEIIKSISKKANKISIATAFFSESNLIKEWAFQRKKIQLIVSLRPPTDYYSLKAVLPQHEIEVCFLGKEFHSKFILFYNDSDLIAAILGSSNFTNGGLINNTETNIYIDNINDLKELEIHYFQLLAESFLLQPTDLEEYKKVYHNFLKRKSETDKEIQKLQNKIVDDRTKRKEKKVNKEAKQYNEFWNIVDEIKNIVDPQLEKYFPGIPSYLVLDHFWHFIKVVWFKKNQKIINSKNTKKLLPKIFKQYINWNENNIENYPKWMYTQSKNIFQKHLSKRNIDSLTKEQAKEIFQSFHSSSMSIMRFYADDKFVAQNDIRRIRKSFKYLLYSNDEMDLKIHNLMQNSNYKLVRMGSSGIQELNGWTNPNKFPIRNDKADEAIKILGYNYK